jgi:hypothetical protein
MWRPIYTSFTYSRVRRSTTRIIQKFFLPGRGVYAFAYLYVGIFVSFILKLKFNGDQGLATKIASIIFYFLVFFLAGRGEIRPPVTPKKIRVLSSNTVGKVERVKNALITDATKVLAVADYRTVKKYLQYYFSKEELQTIYNNQPENLKVLTCDESTVFLLIPCWGCFCSEVDMILLANYCYIVEQYYSDVKQLSSVAISEREVLIKKIFCFLPVNTVLELKILFYYRVKLTTFLVKMLLIFQEHGIIINSCCIENMWLDAEELSDYYFNITMDLDRRILCFFLEYSLLVAQSVHIETLCNDHFKAIMSVGQRYLSYTATKAIIIREQFVRDLKNNIKNNVNYIVYYDSESCFMALAEKFLKRHIVFTPFFTHTAFEKKTFYFPFFIRQFFGSNTIQNQCTF